jgi:hypothetical protein
MRDRKYNEYKRMTMMVYAAICAISLAGMTGCLSAIRSGSPEVSKEIESIARQPTMVANSSGGLIKPEIPPEAEQWPEQSATNNAQPGSARHWEDQKVRVAAIRTAESIPSVKKIKICYRSEYNEWWVSLYDDLGPEIDVKTYIWDSEKERLERHLALKTIPAGKLGVELAKNQPGDACELVDPKAY